MPGRNDALVGTSGTPSSTNKFVTEASLPSGGIAPADADYLVKTANAGLSAERVVTDTASVTVDWGTAGQAKFQVGAAGILPIANGGTGAATANANAAFIGPISGSAAAPSFRALVTADLPAGSGFTRTAVTGTTSPSGTGNMYLAVTTLGSNYAITLPAPTTAGQQIIVADETYAAGSGAYILSILTTSGAFRCPAQVSTVVGLYLAADGGICRLMADGTNWRVIGGGNGWAVDPRQVGTGLILWLDARRGVVYNAATNRLVTTWTDYSGSGNNVTQGTTTKMPTLTQLGALPALLSDGAAVLATANLSTSTGTASVVTTCALRNISEAAATQVIYAWGIAATAGQALFAQATTVNDFTSYDFGGVGDGTNAARSPSAIGYMDPASGAVPYGFGWSQPNVISCVMTATASASGLWVNGVVPFQRTRRDGATTTVSTVPIFIFGTTTTPGSPMKGLISIFALYNTELSAANRAILENDQMRQAQYRSGA